MDVVAYHFVSQHRACYNWVPPVIRTFVYKLLKMIGETERMA